MFLSGTNVNMSCDIRNTSYHITIPKSFCVDLLLKEGNQLAKHDLFLIKLYPYGVRASQFGKKNLGRKRVKKKRSSIVYTHNGVSHD